MGSQLYYYYFQIMDYKEFALGDHYIVIVLELEWNDDGIGYMYIQVPLFSIGSSMVLLVLEKSLREAVRSR